MKRFVKVAVLSMLLFATTLGVLTTQAANRQFTLGAMPAAPSVNCGMIAPVSVNSGQAFVNAYNNASNVCMALSADITLTDAQVAQMTTLPRSLQINGNNRTLTLGGGTGTRNSSVFTLGGTGGSFVLQNITLVKNNQDGANTLIMTNNAAWNVLMSNVTMTSGSNWSSVFDGWDTTRNSRLFIAGNTNLTASTRAVVRTNNTFVIQPNANVTLGPSLAASTVNGMAGSTSVGLIGPGATLNVRSNNDNFLPFSEWDGFDLYTNARLNIYKNHATVAAYNNTSASKGGDIRVDTGASLKLQNDLGPALLSSVGQVSIIGNPSSNVELIGNGPSPAVNLGHATSRIALSEPRFFDIRNNGTGMAFTSINATAASLIITNTDIGAWDIGTDIDINPTAPSPFYNATLITGSTTTLPGSSSIIDTMPGGWNNANYSRIAQAVTATLSADDLSMSLGQVAPINALVSPTTALLTYQAEDTNIVTVDDLGNVSAVGAGATSILITATVPNGVPRVIAINVSVSNEIPVLTVPAFTTLNLNDAFDPMLGVLAQDAEDGNLIGEVVVDSNVNTAVEGVYTVLYSVTDSNANKVEALQVVTVNGGQLIIGANHVMIAHDFERRVSQVDLNPSAIIEAANITVYEKATGLLVTNPNINIVDLGGYYAAVGTYTIDLVLANDALAATSITANVVTGELPVLNVPAFREIPVDVPFDLFLGVTANDAEDGSLIEFVQAIGEFDVTIPGVYTIKYVVQDSDGNRVSTEGVILVNNGEFVLGDSMIIQASDFERRIGQVDVTEDSIIRDADVKLYSVATGKEIENPEINVVDTGGYSTTPQSYEIVFDALSDALATITITATVIPGDFPELFVPDFTDIAVGDSFDVMANVSANDTEDGLNIPGITHVGDVDVDVSGVYTIQYSVTDSDLNTTTASQVVLVQDGSALVGDNNIIFAQDFEKRISQVDLNDTAIFDAATVRVFDKNTGDELTVADAIIFDLGGYSPTVGVYPITFKVINDDAAITTIDATVTAGTPPTLIVPNLTTTPIMQIFDNMANVTATDAEDGPLNNRIQVSGLVDINTAGVYVVNYSVTDSDLNTVTAVQIVVVTDGNVDVGDTTIIMASDFEKRISQVDTDELVIKTSANVSVFNKTTGQLIDSSPVSVDSGSYTDTPGTYPITFTVVADNNASVEINATVITGYAPTIEVPSITEVPLNGDFDPTRDMIAQDIEDGLITEHVVISDNFDLSVEGVYQITYTITDQDKNKATATQVLVVNDGNVTVGARTIMQAHDFTRRVSQVDTTDPAVLLAANVSLYDIFNGIEITDPTIHVDLGGYGPIVNDYTIKFTVDMDPTISKEITATVISGDAPILTVPAFTEVPVNGTFNPMNGVSITDTEDADIADVLVIDDNVVISAVGVYTVHYSVTDSDGNTASATQIVLVNDGSFTAGDTTLIQATDFSKHVSQVEVTDAAIKSAANVKVYNKLTGQELPNEPITLDNGGFSTTPNAYDITFTVTSDTKATTTIVGTVSAGDAPVLIVPQFTEVPLNGTFDPMTGVSVSDTEDPNIADELIYTDSVNVSLVGVFTVTYSVTDSDGNNVTATQVVLVNDGSFTAGDTTLIQASDFVRRVGQVDVSDAAIKLAANVKVYDKLTGIELPSRPVTINNGGFSTTPNDYDITFTVTSDTKATTTIVGTVSTGDAPVLSVPSFTEVALNGTFDPLKGVTVLDTEDANIADALVYTNTVNVAQVGVYVVTYSVVDSDNNTVSASQIVVVNDGSFTIGDTTLIQATDFTRRVNEVDVSDTAIKLAGNVKVYDKLTGSVLDNEPVSVNKGDYSATPGTYDITFTVTRDTKASTTIVGTVSAGSVPVLSVPLFTEVPLNGSFNPMSGVTVSDTEDTNIADALQYISTVNVAISGVYEVTYSVEDTDGNAAFARQTVLVNDGSFTVGDTTLIQATDFTRRVSQVDVSDAAIKLAANVHVYDILSGLELPSVPVSVDNGGYSITPNAYDITFTVTSDTKATTTIVGSVTAGDVPVLSVPSFTEVALNGTFDPMTGVTVTDTEDSNILDELQYTNTVNVAIAGLYEVTYSVADSDGNTVSAKQIVLVNDGSFTPGDTTVIQATDFTRSVSKVDTADAAIKLAANVKVYDKLTGLELPTEPVSVNSGGFSTIPNTYDITFTVTRDTKATTTIVGSVSAGNAPVLIVPLFTEVPLNGTFDPMLGVSVSDTEDANIADELKYTSTVNVAVSGIYEVTYTITDTDNNTVNAKQIVLVNDGSFTAGDTTLIQATDFARRVNEVDVSDAAIKLAANVKVYDKLSGLELPSEPVNVNNGGYSATPGSYDITFTVTRDTKASTAIVGTVSAGGIPILSVPTFTEVPLNGNFEPMMGVSVTDTEDANIDDFLNYTSTVDVTTVGVYEVSYSVTDSDGNHVSAQQIVAVSDDTLVVGDDFIIQANDFTKRVSEVVVTDSALKLAANIRVYDKLTGLQVTNEPLLINNGGYGPIPDVYTINFTVSADPSAIVAIQGTVYIGGLPVLKVPSLTQVPLNGTFNEMAGVTVLDDEDPNIMDKLQIINNVDVTTLGVYRVEYSVTDSDGNTVQAVQIVVVSDGSLVVGDNMIIQASDFAKRIGQVDKSNAAVLLAADVRVYDKVTGQKLDNEPVNVNMGSFGPVANTYPITFSVAADSSANAMIIATVTAGDMPVLTAPALTQVSINSSFNVLDNVFASDLEDGDLTTLIEVTGAVDTSVAGVYPIHYSIKDSDGNMAEATQIVIVSDEATVIGEQYIIQATHFQRRVSQVKLDKDTILADANIRVFDKSTGEYLPNAIVNIVDLGSYHAAVGIYPITFEVENDSLANVTINATVVAGELPVLTVPAFREIQQNAPFDVKSGVSATDFEDGILTNAITVSAEFNITIPGVYTLQYVVVDSDGNRVTKDGVILVNNGTFVVGSQYIINAADFEKRISQIDTSNKALISAANAKLYDISTGKIVANSQITVVDQGGYSTTPGTYQITFAATNDALATTTIEAVVISGEHPVLEVPAFTEVDVGSVFDPRTGLSAIDDHDGDISHLVVISGNVNIDVPGVYVVDYSIIDSDGNSSTAHQVVLVQDGSASFGASHIIFASDFSKRVFEVDLNEVAIFDAANVLVYDKLTGDQLTVAEIKISDLGGYQPKVGNYPITFKAINDASTHITINANVHEGTIPVLTVPSLTEVPLNGVFDAMAGVSAYDKEDGDLTNRVIVTGSVLVNRVGIYTLNYSVTDKDGNTVSATQTIAVSDGELVVGDTRILHATDFVLRVSEVDISNAAIKLAASVRVYDRQTGSELKNEVINITDLGGYNAATGTYQITFQVASEPTTFKTITATVIAGASPVLNVLPFTDVPLNGNFDPKLGVSAIDPEEGDISKRIVVDGIVNTALPGFYKVNYSITDVDGNVVSATQTVLVNDGSMVAGDTTVIQAYDFIKYIQDVDTSHKAIISAAQVKVYDKLTGVLQESEPVEIVDLGGYDALAGVYGITFRVIKDTNAITRITAQVLSDTAPVLTVPTFTQINVNDKFDALRGVRAIDLEDGDIIDSVSVEGFVNTKKAGIYIMDYSVTDSHGNTATARQIVLVNDGSYVYDNGYIIMANDFRIPTSQASSISDAQLIELANVVVYDVNAADYVALPVITVIRNDFSDKVGEYTVLFQFNPEIAITVTVYDDTSRVLPSLPETGSDFEMLYMATLLLSSSSLALFVIMRKNRRL